MSLDRRAFLVLSGALGALPGAAATADGGVPEGAAGPILSRLADYGDALDHGAAETWRDCFAEDAVLDFQVGDPTRFAEIFGGVAVEGRARFAGAAIAGFLARHRVLLPYPTKHVATATRLSDAGGGVVATLSNFQRLDFRDGACVVACFGRYEDRFRRSADGGWRFVHRLAVVEASSSPRSAPAAGGTEAHHAL